MIQSVGRFFLFKPSICRGRVTATLLATQPFWPSYLEGLKGLLRKNSSVFTLCSLQCFVTAFGCKFSSASFLTQLFTGRQCLRKVRGLKPKSFYFSSTRKVGEIVPFVVIPTVLLRLLQQMGLERNFCSCVLCKEDKEIRQPQKSLHVQCGTVNFLLVLSVLMVQLRGKASLHSLAQA